MNHVVLVGQSVWWASWRGLVLGTSAGTVYGGLIGFSLAFVAGGVYGVAVGAIMGAALGTVLGLLNGLVFSLISVVWWHPRASAGAYTRLIRRSSTGFSLLVGLAGLASIRLADPYLAIFFDAT